MDNKEQLRKLLEFINSVAKQQGNEWFVEELIATLATSPNFSNEKINEIHEYCIEKISKLQAKSFYKDFPIKEIISQLEADFIRMESFKRKDNFEDFAMAIYQQIENITNQIIKNNRFREAYAKLLNYPAFIKYEKDSKGKDYDGYERSVNSNYTIAKLLYGSNTKEEDFFKKTQQDITTLYALDKIRAVIYFVYFKGKMKSSDFNDFITITDLINSIYQYRNQNHRGDVLTEYQKNIMEKIDPKRYQYYLKYFGVLVSFVEKIEEGFPISDEFIKYCTTLQNKTAKSINLTVVGKIELPEERNRKK